MKKKAWPTRSVPFNVNSHMDVIIDKMKIHAWWWIKENAKGFDYNLKS